MSTFDMLRISRFIDAHTVRPRIAVETGTFRGETTLKLSAMFDKVHTIELTPNLAAAARQNFVGTNINCLLGDSAELVPQLARDIDEPVFWYLDAHWFPPKFGAPADMSRSNPFPLWSELDSIAERKYADIVVVDDVHAFGREDWGENAPDRCQEWVGLTDATIREHLQRVESTVTAEDKVICYLGK